MASATGIPARHPVTDDSRAGESEPLLGQPGDALQRPDDPLYKNLYSGMPMSPPTMPPLGTHPTPPNRSSSLLTD